MLHGHKPYQEGQNYTSQMDVHPSWEPRIHGRQLRKRSSSGPCDTLILWVKESCGIPLPRIDVQHPHWRRRWRERTFQFLWTNHLNAPVNIHTVQITCNVTAIHLVWPTILQEHCPFSEGGKWQGKGTLICSSTSPAVFQNKPSDLF